MEKTRFYILNLVLMCALFLLISACTTLEGLESLKESVTQFKPDIGIEVDGEYFEGFAATFIDKKKTIKITSYYANFDYLYIHTCGRFIPFRNPKVDNESNWGQPSKNEITYTYEPVESELSGCSLLIEVYDLKGIADYGMVAFRAHEKEHIPATTYCNGEKNEFKGHSVCATKSGLEQTIIFPGSEPIIWAGDANCNMKQISPVKFRFRPVGWCAGAFTNKDKIKFHKLTANGYVRPKVRE